MTSNSALGTMNYANNQPHQLTSYPGKTLTYDNAGNVLNNSNNEFTWDWRSRMTYSRVLLQAEKTYYEYDHNNQRYLKYTTLRVYHPDPCELDGLSGGGGPVAEGLEPGGPILEGGESQLDSCGAYYTTDTIDEDKYLDRYFEKDISNNTKDHIYLGTTKLATVNNSNNPYFILSDHLNSSTILVDNTGTLIEQSDYEPYGKENYNQTSTEVGDDYKYTGQEYDDENALQYFGARYMDNNTARFYSLDPATLALGNAQEFKDKYDRSLEFHLSNPQNLNSYSYVTNNPLKYTDPDGEIIPLLVLAYIGLEIGFSAWDAQDAGNAWFGENSSNGDKAWAGGALLAGLALPGPGKAYTGVGENLLNRALKDIHWNKGADAVLDHFKRHGNMLAERTGMILNNAMEYSKQAKEFVLKSGDNFKYFLDTTENALVKWDKVTHEFLATTKAGDIKTYFIRDNLNMKRFLETTVDEFNKIFK